MGSSEPRPTGVEESREESATGRMSTSSEYRGPALCKADADPRHVQGCLQVTGNNIAGADHCQVRWREWSSVHSRSSRPMCRSSVSLSIPSRTFRSFCCTLTVRSPSSRPWPLSSSWSTFVSRLVAELAKLTSTLHSAVLIQNARKASAALLPPLSTPLPPSMCRPSKQQYEKVVNEMTEK